MLAVSLNLRFSTSRKRLHVSDRIAAIEREIQVKGG